MPKKLKYTDWTAELKAKGGMAWKFKIDQVVRDLNEDFKVFLAGPTVQKKENVTDSLEKWGNTIHTYSQILFQQTLEGRNNIIYTLSVTPIIPPLALLQPQAIDSETYLYTGYRGDTRLPVEIAKEGFKLWPSAAQVLLIAGGLGPYFRDTVMDKYAVPADFMRYCVAEKDRLRPTLATSLDEDCGGYSSGIVYKIEIGDMQRIDMSANIMGMTPQQYGWSGASNQLPMYINRGQQNISQCDSVGINLNVGTHEVVFMKDIAPQYIVEYFDKVTGKFVDMPTV